MVFHRASALMSIPSSSNSSHPGRLTLGALQLRSSHRYAAHPVESTLRHYRDLLDAPREEGHGGLSFESAESIYRAGAQGLPLSQIPQLPQSVVELTRLRSIDQVARRHLARTSRYMGCPQTGGGRHLLSCRRSAPLSFRLTVLRRPEIPIFPEGPVVPWSVVS